MERKAWPEKDVFEEEVMGESDHRFERPDMLIADCPHQAGKTWEVFTVATHRKVKLCRACWIERYGRDPEKRGKAAVKRKA